MPYDIPRSSLYRIQPFKMQDDEALVATMAQQLLKARLMEARAAAGGGRRGGGGGSGKEKKGKGAWVMVLNKDTGRYEKKWIEGSTGKERAITMKAEAHNEALDRLGQSPEVEKLLGALRNPGASNLTKQEALKKINALRSDPAFSDLNKEGVNEAFARFTKPFAAEVQEEKRKIESSGRLGALGTSAKIAGEKFSTWLDELIHGADAPEVIESSKRSLERQRAMREADPYLHEQDLRSAEEPEVQRGWYDKAGGALNVATNVGSTLLSDPGLGLALGGGAIATAGTGGLAAPLAGAALAATGGAMSADIMFKERLAGDENLSDAEKARAYDEGALQEKAIGAGLNVIPAVSPAAIRGWQLGRAAAGLAGAEAQAARAARAAELNKFGNQMRWNVLPASGEAAALNAAQMAGSNIHYGSLTHQNVDIGEGVPEAAGIGAMFGLATGLGGAVRAARTPKPVQEAASPESPDGGTPGPQASRDDLVQEVSRQMQEDAAKKGKKGKAPASGGATPPAPPAAPAAPAAPSPTVPPQPAPPAAPSPTVPPQPAPPAAPSSQQTASAPAASPQATPASPAFAPRSAPNLTPEQAARVPELQELSRHVVPSRSAVWDKDPELMAAREMASGSVGSDAVVAGDWANARFAELLIRDEAKIRGDRQVKKFLKEQEKAAKAKRQKDAEVQAAMDNLPRRAYARDSGVRSTPSGWSREVTTLEDMQRRVAAEQALANRRTYARDSGVRNTPSGWSFKPTSLEDMQLRVAAERQAKANAAKQAPVQVPQGAAAATAQTTGIGPAGVATSAHAKPKATSRAVKAATSAKEKKAAPVNSGRFATSLTDKDLAFISTAGRKTDEAMDSLMPPKFASEKYANEILRVLNKALDDRDLGDSSRQLKSFIEGAARTLKYLQDIKNITPEVTTNGAEQPASAAAPVQQSTRIRKKAANPENSGTDSSVETSAGTPAEASSSGTAEAARDSRPQDQGVGAGGRPGGRADASENTQSGAGTPRPGREPDGQRPDGEPSSEQPADVGQKAGEGAGRTEPPAGSGEGSAASGRSYEDALAEARERNREEAEAASARAAALRAEAEEVGQRLHQSGPVAESVASSLGRYLERFGTAPYLENLGILMKDGFPVDTLANRAHAMSKLAALGDTAKESPALARRQLEALQEAFGIGNRAKLEEMIQASEDRFTQESLRRVLDLLRPGEEAAVAAPLHVSERLSAFSAQPPAVHNAVFNLLSGVTDLSSESFNARFGEKGERFHEFLSAIGLGSEESLSALNDIVREWKNREAVLSAAERERLGEADLLDALENGKAENDKPARKKPLSPVEKLAVGIEAAGSRVAEYAELAANRRAEAEAKRMSQIARMPMPERMTVLFNSDPEIRRMETGEPEWNAASADLANRALKDYRAYGDSRRGDPNFLELEQKAKAWEARGFTEDFFQSLVPGKNLLDDVVPHKVTAEDIRLAYDPEAALREEIAAQREGLSTCFR